MVLFAKKLILAVFGLHWIVLNGSFGAGDTIERVPVAPICTRALGAFATADLEAIRRDDNMFREFLLRKTFGEAGLKILEKVIGAPCFERVQTLADALRIVDRAMDDPRFYKPILQILNALPPAESWAAYINSGYYAAGHTDGNREMIDLAVGQLPTQSGGRGPVRKIDWGMGSGSAVVADMIINPEGIVHGMDIAGAGLTVGMFRANRVSDLLSVKYTDPGFTTYGRFSLSRGSITDPVSVLKNHFDGGTMVLALFTVPLNERPIGLANSYDSLRPGGVLSFVDPVDKLHEPAIARQLLENVVKSSYRNNPDLTYLDVAILAVKNAQQLLQKSTQFMDPSQHRHMIQQAGFVVGSQQPIYYNIATMIKATKPERPHRRK